MEAPKAGSLKAWVLDPFGAQLTYTILTLEKSLLVKMRSYQCGPQRPCQV